MSSFSVCMSVYFNDKPADFRTAVESVCCQTVPPSEIILVVDGPIPGVLDHEICLLADEIEMLKVIRLEKNQGHAVARQTGLKAASNELVAVMDSDDIALSTRFEKQLEVFRKHPEVSVVGGLIHEFVDELSNVVGVRMVPQNDREIKSYMRSRCPMNMVTVMLRKTDVQKAGGYLDWYCEEDYYLWVRLALKGCCFHNIQENLVHVRVGKEMYARRGGWRYFKSETTLQKYMWRHHLISFPRFAYNVAGRFAVEVIMPDKLRGLIFRKLLRR